MRSSFSTQLIYRSGSPNAIELVQWLTSPDHPLTSRVFVNRVWKHLFGQGLVATVDNFGTSGEEPSHPELLDTLAVEFTNDGWSTKRLIFQPATSGSFFFQ